MTSAARFTLALVPLRALRWLAPGTDRVAALTTQPSECLPPAAIGDRAVEVGRAAFRSPLLLGGQASRAGLSCNACHLQGRGNPDFAFPGLSGAPGTADVTSSLFSSHRGDGIANPVPIPDLSAANHKISRDPASPALADFINGLVVDEFDGAPPPPAVRAGLAAYVRALSPSTERRRSFTGGLPSHDEPAFHFLGAADNTATSPCLGTLRPPWAIPLLPRKARLPILARAMRIQPPLSA